MNVFDVRELTSRLDRSTPGFSRFFREGPLSLAVGYWPAGSQDNQEPHADDEVYYIAAGRARLRAGDEDSEMAPGTIAYVPAGMTHHFHSIEEDLHVLVFFASPRPSEEAAA